MGFTRRSSLNSRLIPRFPPGKRYVPHVPHPPQQAFLLLGSLAEVFYGGAAGGGKSDAGLMGALQYAMDVSTPVPTPAGWSTIGNLRPGDHVYDETGQPTRVTAKSRRFTKGDRYRLHFDDGAELVADGDHLWVAESFGDRITLGKGLSVPMRTISTREMHRTQLTDHARPQAMWSVRLAAPLDTPDADLPIDPYVLGAWLGDGTKRDGTMAGIDPEMIEEFRTAGYEVAPPYTEASWHVRGLRTQLEALGVRNNKHIPAAYLRASRAQRLALLQGLMDTDGTVDSRWGIPRFGNTDRGLIEGVKELVVSLGWKAREFTEPYVTKKNKLERTIWHVTFLPDVPVFRLPRKADKQVTGRARSGRRAQAWRMVQRIERLPDDSCTVQCITVDSPSHLFLAGSAMIPTHNCDVPGYSALIIRRTFQDLALPGAIMARAEEWLTGTGARKRDGGKMWEFPTSDPGRPATLQFGYAQTHADVYRYQGAEFQYVFVDELTHFEERTYRYLFSRVRGPSAPCGSCGHPTSQPAGQPRQHDEDHDHCACGHEHLPWEACWAADVCGCAGYRPVGCECLRAHVDREALDPLGRPLFAAAPDGTTLADVPLRVRSGSNPGGVGHEWVRARFIDPETKVDRAVFVPAKLADNPSLDRKAYRQGLGELTLVEQRRLEDGDWDVADEGDTFQRSWFEIVDEAPADCRWVRYWDKAATVPKDARSKAKQGKSPDPDWTVGSLLGLSPQGIWYLQDVIRFRESPMVVEREIKQAAALDGRRVPVRIEQEPGASGVADVDTFRRNVLVGYDFDGHRPTLSKEERAAPMARAAQAGNFKLVSAPWNRQWLDEVAGFPALPHDDQVDSASGAMDVMVNGRRARIIA